jgi:hypothetical protein
MRADGSEVRDLRRPNQPSMKRSESPMPRIIMAAVAVSALLICAGPAAADDDAALTTAIANDDVAVSPAGSSGDDVAVSPAAGSHDDVAVTPAGLLLSMVHLATRALALTVVPIHQFPAFDAVIMCESGWNTFAINPTSGAYGLGQALPPEKMETHGPDWRFNPLTQIRWTYDYMNQRYGGPDGAWAFWQEHHWY